MMNSTPKKLTTLSLLTLAGFITSIYQTYHFFQIRYGLAGFQSFCTVGVFDCQKIDLSKYAELIPGLPLSAFAAGWFFVFFIATLFARSDEDRSKAIKASLFFSSISIVFSIVYLFIMLFKIKSLCLLCLGIDAINLALFLIVISIYLKEKISFKFNVQEIKFTATLSLVAVAFAFFISFFSKPESFPKREVNFLISKVLNAPAVPIQIPSTQASVGPMDAPITIVKFSDFQCPSCQRGANSIHPLMKKYEKQIRFVFFNFPLDSKCNRKIEHTMHPAACEAARLAWCANQKGQYMLAYHELFSRQSELAPGKLIDLFSAHSEMDLTSLKQCVESPESLNGITAEIEQGIHLGIQSTPTFYINGKKIEGYLPTPVWEKIIDSLLR